MADSSVYASASTSAGEKGKACEQGASKSPSHDSSSSKDSKKNANNGADDDSGSSANDKDNQDSDAGVKDNGMPVPTEVLEITDAPMTKVLFSKTLTDAKGKPKKTKDAVPMVGILQQANALGVNSKWLQQVRFFFFFMQTC